MALRPTFLAFETSRKSIMSAQKALDITGNNIGNINTPGYTRQRVDFFSVASTSGGIRYSSRVPLAGQGVYAAGVKQVRDPFLDRRYRELQASSSTQEITAGILVDIEDVLDNIENTGLQDSILDFQEKLQAFSSGTADGIELANIARTSAQNVTQMLRDYDKKLNQIMDQSKFELSAAVGNVNSIIDKLSKLNAQIKDEYNRSGSEDGYIIDPMTYGPNELLDSRNMLLDELSQYIDIEVANNTDGTVKVTAGGSAVIVDVTTVTKKIKELSDPVPDAIALTFADDSTPVSLNDGMLKGYIEMINGNGIYAATGPTDLHGIPYYKSVIDTFAQTLAKAFNEENGAIDSDGNVLDPDKLMFTAIDDTTKTISASNIKVSAAWQADALMISKVNGEYVYKDSQVAVLQSFTWEFANPNSPLPSGWKYDQVTEAYTPPNYTEWTADKNSPIGWKPKDENSLFEKSSAGVWVSKTALPSQWVKSKVEYVTKTTLDNSQLLKLLGVFDKKMDFGPSGEFKGTMDSYIDFYTNRLGQQTEFAISQYETSGIMVNNILSSRDSTSSVSMDEEGINMLNYQKWLNASSRMMTTLDEALDMIINQMGIVGR